MRCPDFRCGKVDSMGPILVGIESVIVSGVEVGVESVIELTL